MDRVGAWRWRACALALLASLGLAACGGDGSDSAVDEPTTSASPSESESGSPEESVPPGTAACSEVWVEGARLERSYRGCEENGSYVKIDPLGCSSGQRMARHADHFYAVLGGTIHQTDRPLDQDREYTAAVRRCRA